jgi:four helix bundle protein
MPNHPPGRNHRKLIAWQEAIKLVVLVYREARSFPREELFGLTAQVKKSVNSIASNIAEGAARNSSRELVQFLGYANGSRAETDSHLEVAVQLGFLRADSEVFLQLERVGQLVTALRKSIRSRIDSDPGWSTHNPTIHDPRL